MPATTTPTVTSRSFDELRGELQDDLLRGYPELIARMRWSREQILDHQRARLRALLAHAVAHSPFHARRLAGVDIDAVGPEDLSALPAMTKTEMMNAFDDVVTDRRRRRGLVEDALAATASQPQPVLDEYVAFTSGGSSGQRGVFVLDRSAQVQFVGSLTRGLVARIQAMGGPPPGGLPVPFVAAASAVHPTGTAAAVTAGGLLPFRFLPVPNTLPLSEIVESLNTMRPPVLFGYPTMLARLAGEQQAGRLRIAPTAMTCSGETCTPELRTAITRAFRAPLVDTFGSSEGLVGSSPPDDDVITFAEDGCILELVDEHHRPVPPGTPSAAVLITNLHNRLQPLIRYELTDSFTQQPPAADHGHLRARVHGRADDIFHYGPVTVHPLVVRSVLVQTPDVLEYQVRQTPTGIDVTAVAGPGLDRADLRNRLALALDASGLPRPQVSVQVAADLERHPDTGKLRRFVPLGTGSAR
jgi:phenylacetate-CoA ligase